MNRLFVPASQNLPFSNMSRLFLIENMCLTNNSNHTVQQFAAFQLDIGSGHTIAPDGTMRFPEDLILHGSTFSPLIHHIYPDLSSVPPPLPQSFMDCMILAPQNENDDIHLLNHDMIDKFKA